MGVTVGVTVGVGQGVGVRHLAPPGYDGWMYHRPLAFRKLLAGRDRS